VTTEHDADPGQHQEVGDALGQLLEERVDGAVSLRGVYCHLLAFGVDLRAAMAEDWETTRSARRETYALLRGLLVRRSRSRSTGTRGAREQSS